MIRKLRKADIERICRMAGMKPVWRDRIREREIFIADGFSLPPHKAFDRFEISSRDFPHGMYATMWWAAKGEDELAIGAPFFCDAFHDPKYSREEKLQLRIKTAMKLAEEELRRKKKAR